MSQWTPVSYYFHVHFLSVFLASCHTMPSPNDLEDYKATNNYSHMNKKFFWRNCSIEISLEFPPTGDKKLHASLHRFLHQRHMP